MAHIQCWAHKLNINASLWGLYLPELNMCVSNVKNAFLNSRKRKHSTLNTKKNAKLFPSHVMTRWYSWFHSVEYIAEYLEDLIEFLTGVDSGVSAEYFTNLIEQLRACNHSVLC
ncbi:hypothetical protein PR048_015411 [Dryococelus australis]|uniref:Transposase n=1 Tax=Dryococelus australis TaxID=614101 RepID=A0ABQ9HH55_9NEOP|nr:hypothetical protein PR048_015411 [Dryococelus australis]